VGDLDGAFVGTFVGALMVGFLVGPFVGDLDGAFVGTFVRALIVGFLVGPFVGDLDGAFVGPFVGSLMGFLVGPFVGDLNGAFVGTFVGALMGFLVGQFVGDLDGAFVGDLVGLFAGALTGDCDGAFVGLLAGAAGAGTVTGAGAGAVTGAPLVETPFAIGAPVGKGNIGAGTVGPPLTWAADTSMPEILALSICVTVCKPNADESPVITTKLQRKGWGYLWHIKPKRNGELSVANSDGDKSRNGRAGNGKNNVIDSRALNVDIEHSLIWHSLTANISRDWTHRVS
jgi:hypothetical protein